MPLRNSHSKNYCYYIRHNSKAHKPFFWSTEWEKTHFLKTDLSLWLGNYCFTEEVLVKRMKKQNSKAIPVFLLHSAVNTTGILLCLLIKYNLCYSGNSTLKIVWHSHVASVPSVLKNYSSSSYLHCSLCTTDLIHFSWTGPMGTAASS